MNRPFQMRRAAAPAGPQWTVSALLQAVSDALDARFGMVTVTGELSGFARASSGHWYFGLKDEAAQVRCVMFRGRNALAGFEPADGQLVELRAQLGLYAPRGDLQLIVESMRPAGRGAMHERFLQLKAKLEAEGLFDAARKRPVPALPRALGVVTSLQAAALHDVLTALARRAPHVPVVIYPAAVQGAAAPQALRAALLTAAARVERDGIDTLLLVRGGGSIEDLWAFNDEALARAIAAFPRPVVSGVGHETDFTIADFVADLRAPTPTAAAELAAVPRAELWTQLQAEALALRDAVDQRLAEGAQRLDRAEQALALLRHAVATERMRLAQAAQRLHGRVAVALSAAQARLQAAARLAGQPAVRLGQARRELARCAQHWRQATLHAQARRRDRLLGLQRVLQALDPQRTLERGYSIVLDEERRAVRSVRELRRELHATVRVADGEAPVRITPREPS
jgi:exodeoxyribonuclease VII large subunit